MLAGEILLAVLVVFNLFLTWLFIRLLRENALRWATYLLIALVVCGIGVALLTGFSLWVVGTATVCLSTVNIFLSFSILVIMRARSFQIFGRDKRRWLYLGGGLLILFVQLFPPAGFYGVDRACNAMAHARGEGMVLALERYKQDHEIYPEQIDELVPEYLPAQPSVCSRDFDLVRCPEGDTLLVVGSPNGMGADRFNLNTGRWSAIDTLDFGICDFVE